MIKKALIPAAGLGTRFLPATKSLAKEMLPIVDKPCIQFIVEEAVKSGIREIIIIISPGKDSIKDHFSVSKKLHEHLEKAEKFSFLNAIKKIENLAQITYVTQNEPLGDGHAILCARHLIKNEPFAVLFGDDIYDSKTPPLSQLIKKYQRLKAPIVGLFKIDKRESKKYGMVKTSGQNMEIKALVEKPDPKNSPSNLAISGKYIVTTELLEILSKIKSGSKDKEIHLIDGMRKYVKDHKIYGHEIKGKRFDTGDKLGYLKAVVHFGLKHQDLKNDFKDYLKKVVGT